MPLPRCAYSRPSFTVSVRTVASSMRVLSRQRLQRLRRDRDWRDIAVGRTDGDGRQTSADHPGIE